MCMCQKNKFYLSQSHWYFCIFIIIRSLLHSAVYKKLVTCCLQIITGSRNLMSCPDKCNLHIKTSLLIFMHSRNLFVLDFMRRFFVRCARIFEAYAVRTLIKFGCIWRKISHKSKCNKDSESTFLISPIVLLHFACLNRQLFTAFMILLYCINYTLQ